MLGRSFSIQQSSEPIFRLKRSKNLLCSPCSRRIMRSRCIPCSRDSHRSLYHVDSAPWLTPPPKPGSCTGRIIMHGRTLCAMSPRPALRAPFTFCDSRYIRMVWFRLVMKPVKKENEGGEEGKEIGLIHYPPYPLYSLYTLSLLNSARISAPCDGFGGRRSMFHAPPYAPRPMLLAFSSQLLALSS